MCNMNCLQCEFTECVNDSDILSYDEMEFSQSYDSEIERDRKDEKIRQIDDPKKRAIAKYRQTPKGKEMIHRMNTNDLAKKRFKKYEQSEKGKERRKRHEAKPERQAYRKEYMKKYNKMYYEKKKKEKENESLQVKSAGNN